MDSALIKSVDLLLSAQRGDPQALALLCGRYDERIRRLVHRRMNSTLRAKADTNDLVNDVLLSVLRNVDNIEIRDDRSFGKWITRVVSNAVIDLARRKATSNDDAIESRAEQAAKVTPPPDGAVRNEERRRTLEALAKLPPDQRRVVELRDFDGLPYAEIATRMDRLTEDAVRMLHRRALVRLSALIADPGPAGPSA